MRITYRVRQFWQALTVTPSENEISKVRQVLSPPLMEIFSRMHRRDQVHSLWMFQQLCQQGENNKDLFVAALLHDVGKSCYSLRLWERVWIVLAKALFPSLVRSWGEAEPHGWKKPFVIAAQHAAWGAELVETLGATPLTVALIRRHHDLIADIPDCVAASLEDQLLRRLQALDDER